MVFILLSFVCFSYVLLLPSPTSRVRELNKARKNIDWYKERRSAAESAKAEAEHELSIAKKAVKDLSSMIEESRYKAKARMKDLTLLENLGKGSMNNDSLENSLAMRELEDVKQKLFRLKLDVGDVLGEKLKAEKEIEESRLKMESCSRTEEFLRKKIEEVNEEQVLVELARIDALKEVRVIEAQRENEASEFVFELEKIRKRLNEAVEVIDKSKELEMKLAMTLSDVDVLQHELKLVKEMEKMVQRHESMGRIEGSFGEWEKARDSLVLKTIKEEIEAVKEELALIRKEGFRFMATMDVIRDKLKPVIAEIGSLKKQESKAGSQVEKLSSKILRAKSKLESLVAAEENATRIVIDLLHTLDKLNSEIEAAKKVKELANQEVASFKEEIEKAEFEKDMVGERLQGAMKELEEIKLSESLALEKLKTATENTKRGLATHNGSMITISRFEYEYLTNHASEANEIADKKVEAAKAWIEAFKASEKEIVMRTEIAESEIKETKRVIIKEDLENLWPRKYERSEPRKFQRSISQKSIKSNGSLTPSKGSKFQKSDSPACRVSPFAIRKKKKVLPNLTKFFRGKKKKNNKS